MLRPVIVPLDGSALAEHALVPAVTIAKSLDAKLHLIRVREDAEAIDRDEAYLSELSSRLEAEVGSEKLTLAKLEGSISEAIIEYAQTTGAWMIVMASRRHDGLHRTLLSSVTDKVIREAGLPVLVTGPETASVERSAAWECNRILIPLDGSTLSRQIIHHAANLAHGFKADVTLLHVLRESANIVAWSETPLDREPEETLAQQRATAELERVAQVLRDAGVSVDVRVLRTTVSTAETIANEALDSGADLIALTTRGNGLAKRLVFGSVAHELIERVVSPILVLNPDESRDSQVFVVDLMPRSM